MASLEGDIATVINSPTTLYRYLTDLTCQRGGKAPTIPEAPKHSTKLEGDRLRSLLHGIALSINAYGSELISEEELQLRLESLDIGDLSALEDEEYPLTRLMVSFYFKQSGEHSGCEFLHKSFREYLAAEGIVEVLKEYGRMCQTAPEEKPTSEYWREFDANDPRHWLTRKLGEILSGQWLSTAVMRHLISLVGWDVGRSRTEPEGAVQQMSGTATKLLPAERWTVVRDALADLWDWWGEGVHLRAQPELKQKIWNLEKPAFVAELCKLATRRVNYNQRTPPPTKRTATIDANLGYGLFQLCAAVHWHVSANAGWTTLAASAEPAWCGKSYLRGQDDIKRQ
jgi:hypothetical protein